MLNTMGGSVDVHLRGSAALGVEVVVGVLCYAQERNAGLPCHDLENSAALINNNDPRLSLSALFSQ
jgi:hypothetical protein